MEGLASGIEPLFRGSAGLLALGIEMVAVVVIGWGAVVATAGLLTRRGETRRERFDARKNVWLRFGLALLLGLEFTLAADIVRTAIAPTWNDIGMLAAIAGIRTFLNYFLERDMEVVSGREAREASGASGASEPA